MSLRAARSGDSGLTLFFIILPFMLILLSGAGPSVAGTVAEPPGYRQDKFRADVPATLKGAAVVSTGEAKLLWDAGKTLFIDVIPRPPKPANLPAGTVWQDMRRDSIPGSFWLPNVGYDQLHPAIETYFKTQLERLTGGERGKAILIYCLERCWMSWNAAKRALVYGYTNLIWYPDGTDGWAAAGHPLERKKPEK